MLVRGDKVERRIRENTKHRRGVGVEERHFIGQFGGDLQNGRHLGDGIWVWRAKSADGPPIVAKVVLYRRIEHLQVVKFENKVENVSKLLD